MFCCCRCRLDRITSLNTSTKQYFFFDAECASCLSTTDHDSYEPLAGVNSFSGRFFFLHLRFVCIFTLSISSVLSTTAQRQSYNRIKDTSETAVSVCNFKTVSSGFVWINKHILPHGVLCAVFTLVLHKSEILNRGPWVVVVLITVYARMHIRTMSVLYDNERFDNTKISTRISVDHVSRSNLCTVIFGRHFSQLTHSHRQTEQKKKK